MSIDIYVLPLWKFFAGDYESVLERFSKQTGVPAKVVTPTGVKELRPRQPPDEYRVNLSKRKVRNVSERVNDQNRTIPIQWNDEGECVYAERAVDYGMKSLRTYALWLCLTDQLASFEAPPDGDFYKHPIWSRRRTAPVALPHLIDHDCFYSYYLPCDFPTVAKIEKVMLGAKEGHRQAASSIRLKAELEDLGVSLESNVGLRELPPKDVTAIHAAYLQLSTVAALSCDHGLPIAFHG